MDAKGESMGIVDVEECLDVEVSSSSMVSFGVDWASGITCRRVRLIGKDGGILDAWLKVVGEDWALTGFGKGGKALAPSGLGVKLSLMVGEVKDFDEDVWENIFCDRSSSSSIMSQS